MSGDDTSTVLREISHVKEMMIGVSRSIRASRRDNPADILIKSIVCLLLANRRSQDADLAPIVTSRYPREQTKILDCMNDLRGFLEKAVTAPAQTTVANWAGELANTAVYGVLPLLAPQSLYSRLAARPSTLKLNFSGLGGINVPSRDASADVGGAFVGEAEPIPVRSLALLSTGIKPSSAKIIVLFSDELRRRSLPSVEAIVRQMVAEDTGKVIDGNMLAISAGTAIQPAGLLNGVAPITATAGGGTNALAGDLGKLAAAVENADDLVYLMNESERVRALTLAPGLLAVPILSSPFVPAKQVVAVDAASLMLGETDVPSFDVSSEAVIHQENTTPKPIVDGAGVAATPSMSLFQTDVLGLRAIVDCSWGLRGSGHIATITGVTW